MKKEVKVTDEAGNVKQCAVMRGCFMEGKSASLGLALLYATGNEGKLYVMDADFVKALLKDINELNAIIHKDVLNNNAGQSEQLPCDECVSCQRELFIAMIDKMKESDWREADNGFAGRVFDRLNGNK